MGEPSIGRSATVPTAFKSTSVRTTIERQYSQTVCTLLDHLNAIGAPQLGQRAARLVMTVGPIEPADVDRLRAEKFPQAEREVPRGPRATAEEIQAERAVFGKRVARQVRFGQQTDT